MLLQPLDNLLHVLALTCATDERCVRCIDDDQVFEPDDRGEASFTLHENALAVNHQRVAFDVVARFVLVK